MSSFLFSPLCLDPLQGILDFTADVKPFHTKVVQAGVSLSFSDTMKVSIREQLLSDIEQLFHTHRGNCAVEPVPCTTDGFESEVFDDEFGFEPTIRYTLAEYPQGTPTVGMLNFVGFSAAGNPVFVVAEDCPPLDPICPEGFELSSYDQAYFDGADPDCLATCNDTTVGPCSTPAAKCADVSPTTLATTFAEELEIIDMTTGVVQANVIGSTPFLPIYAHNLTIKHDLEIVRDVDGQVVFYG